MPTITFLYEDLCSLIGKKPTEEELIELLDYAKAELEAKLTTEVTVKFNDTNQPYLWSAEGIARLIRSVLGKSKGIPKLKLEKSDLVVKVDKSVSSVRPYIALFIAKGPPLTQYLLDQLIQLQEKLATNYGRKRQKAGAGLFPLQKVEFPLTYKAVDPTSVSYIPLGMHEKLNLKQVLEKHQKGKEYSWILKDAKKYPVVFDNQKQVLTFPPIVNSETSGKVTLGDSELVCEVTGTDLSAVNLVSTIFAYVLSDRGFKIYPAKIQYGAKTHLSPDLTPKTHTFNMQTAKTLLGLDLSEKEIKQLLERAQYNVLGKNKVEIPPYRKDIMHEVDIIEDIAILYGYSNIEPLPLTTYTQGGLLPIQSLIDAQRTLWVGQGYQESMSAVLTNKQLLTEKMNTPDQGTVEIENFMSQTYSCVRSWILPILLELLSKNKHVDYPQKIFEQGIISLRGKEITDEQHIAAVSAHTNATFTEMKQAIENVLHNTHVEYTIEELDHTSFIPGRAARILVCGAQVGILGEIHPKVLRNFGLLVPVVGCELNINGMQK